MKTHSFTDEEKEYMRNNPLEILSILFAGAGAQAVRDTLDNYFSMLCKNYQGKET